MRCQGCGKEGEANIPDQALKNVKIVDLTWYISGPHCTKLLADYGADVIKVERPGGGDPARQAGADCAPLNNMEEVLQDPHFRAKSFWAEIDQAVTGKLTYPGGPIVADDEQWAGLCRALGNPAWTPGRKVLPLSWPIPEPR